MFTASTADIKVINNNDDTLYINLNHDHESDSQAAIDHENVDNKLI